MQRIVQILGGCYNMSLVLYQTCHHPFPIMHMQAIDNIQYCQAVEDSTFEFDRHDNYNHRHKIEYTIYEELR